MEVIKGTLSCDVERIIANLGSNMYKGDIAETAVKELAQNGFDAIKVAEAMGMIAKGILTININSFNRVITVKDNGCGMSPEIVQKAFFTIGGTHKGNIDARLRSGGYGFAKVAFIFSSEHLTVTTVHNGVKTVIDADSSDIRKSSFDLVVTNTDEPNGTEVIVKLPEYLEDINGSKTTISMWNARRFMDKPLLGNVTLVYDGKECDKSSLGKEYLFLGTAKADFGELDIYIRPSSGSIQYDVLSSGFYQFTKSIWAEGNSDMGLQCVINIKPYYGTESRLYPINAQRQGFRETCEEEVNDLEALLKKIQRAYVMGRYNASFSSCLSMDVRELAETKRIPYAGEILEDTVSSIKEELGIATPEDFMNVLHVISEIRKQKKGHSSFDASGVNVPEIAVIDLSHFDVNKPVFHNNTTMEIGEDATPFLKEFAAMLLEIRNLYAATYEGVVRTPGRWEDPVNVSEVLMKQYWGISFDKEYLGIKVSPKIFDFIGLNPFGHKLPTYKGVNPSIILTECLVHAIIHELNHNFASGEGSTFTSNLVITEAEFVGIGELYEEWKKSLYTLVENNLDLIVKYHKMYEEASNKGDSLRE